MQKGTESRDSVPFSVLLLFTQRRSRGNLRTSHVQEFSEFRPTEGCAGLLRLVLWRPRNDGARSEILTTAPIERGTNDHPYHRNFATCLCKSCRAPVGNCRGNKCLQHYICPLHSYCAWRCHCNSR